MRSASRLAPKTAGRKARFVFYGSSFLTDETGQIVSQADRSSENVLTARYDFDRIRKERLNWGLFSRSKAGVLRRDLQVTARI